MIVFAKQHNLWVTVRSSGHSFIGRSTHDGAIVIDMRTMKGIDFNLNSTRCPAGEVTVESGNAWIDVYKAVSVDVGHVSSSGFAITGNFRYFTG